MPDRHQACQHLARVCTAPSHLDRRAHGTLSFQQGGRTPQSNSPGPSCLGMDEEFAIRCHTKRRESWLNPGTSSMDFENCTGFSGSRWAIDARIAKARTREASGACDGNRNLTIKTSPPECWQARTLETWAESVSVSLPAIHAKASGDQERISGRRSEQSHYS